MTDKTIIEEEVKKVLKLHGCIVDDGYSNYEERLINGMVTVISTQLTLAEKRGEEKAILAMRKDYEFHVENQYEHIDGLQDAIERMFNRVLKQSQEREEK